MTDITKIINSNMFMSDPEDVKSCRKQNRDSDEVNDKLEGMENGEINAVVDQNATTPDNFESYKEIVEETKILCSNCDKHLLTIIVVDKSYPESKLMVYCPCGDHSFAYTIKGKAFQDVGPSVQIKDTTFDSDTNYMEVFMV